jgi:tripartite-type tricarboxylate transporter receptor subunit TctC
LVPKGLPAAEKARLVDGLKEIISNPSFKKDMENIGMSVAYQGPDEFSERWPADIAKLTKIVQETGIAALIAKQKN